MVTGDLLCLRQMAELPRFVQTVQTGAVPFQDAFIAVGYLGGWDGCCQTAAD